MSLILSYFIYVKVNFKAFQYIGRGANQQTKKYIMYIVLLRLKEYSKTQLHLETK